MNAFRRPSPPPVAVVRGHLKKLQTCFVIMITCGMIAPPFTPEKNAITKTLPWLNNGVIPVFRINYKNIRGCSMRNESILKRLSTLEDSLGKAAFSVVLERAVFKRGESRVTGRILIRPGQGGYIAV